MGFFDGSTRIKGEEGWLNGPASYATTSNATLIPAQIYDLVGNVDEWVQDCWNPTFDGSPADGTAWVDQSGCNYRVVRGGSLMMEPLLAIFRMDAEQQQGNSRRGFRCVADQ